MSLSLALRSALSGLSAAQTAIQVTSDNVTNANTPGHTRKFVENQSRLIAAQGAGVDTGIVSREVDDFLLSQIRDQQSTVGQLTVRDRFLAQIQNMFGSPETNRTISSSLNDLKTSFEALAATPESQANASDVVNIARQTVQLFNDLSNTIQDLRAEADREIERIVTQLDSRFEIVAGLNVQIANAEILNQSSAALRDERDRALAEIATNIDIRIVEQNDGTVSLFSAGGRLLVDRGSALAISHDAVSQASASIAYVNPGDPTYPGGITGIFVNGSTAAADDITDEIRGGSLKALIDMRDTELPNLQRELDELAQTLIAELNKAHNAGTAFPPPSTLTGSQTFGSTDVFSATGSVRVAVLDQNTGVVVETLDIALGAMTTVDDLRTAVNGMTNVTATFNAAGQLVVSANTTGQGIAINELTSAVTTVGGETRGVSHFFGLNDLFQANVDGTAYDSFSSARQNDSTTALGLTGTLTFNAAGVSTTVGYTAGQNLDTIAANITANGALAGANISARVVDDGAGRRLIVEDTDGNNFVMTDSSTLLSSLNVTNESTSVSNVITVRGDIVSNQALVARGTLSSAGGLAAGDDGLTVGDGSAAAALAGVFDTTISFGSAGGLTGTSNTLSEYAATILSVQAAIASNTSSELDFNSSFLETLEFRNGSISGVNIDEELANLIVFEQAFNASARVITIASDLLEELINIVR